MNDRCRSRSRRSVRSMKAPVNQEKERAEMYKAKIVNAKKTTTSFVRERKIFLQQEVDKLKKRLRHEENIRRALERAFTRPLGALPRLPSYLPPNTIQLLAEVAVLEEEVIQLEEKIVHFRQELYQEAIYISSSKRSTDDSYDFCEPITSIPKPRQPRSLFQAATNSTTVTRRNLHQFSDERRGEDNQSSTNSTKSKLQSENVKVKMVRNPVQRCASTCRHLDFQKPQLENRIKLEHQSSEERNPANQEDPSPRDNNLSKISEDILRCLMNIFISMNSVKSRSKIETLPSEKMKYAEFKDPYGVCSKFGKRDIGPYRHLFCIEAPSVKSNQMTKSVFLVQRLKLLLEKLASVELKGLTHQEKLAFWINIYNACMMNAFIEYGIPECPEMVVALMQRASVNVGGHILNAITIEHFILRLPYHSKYTFSKGAKHEQMTTRSLFSLELSEPLVTFALSCGSWSSPAVRVYTASQVENELETAKKEYLQAAIGISTAMKVIAIPKLLDWYLLDFAKDTESLVDWICLQLPHELGKEAMKCLETTKGEQLQKSIEIMPYEFNFRYLLHT